MDKPLALSISAIQDNEIPAAHQLVMNGFDRFVAPGYSEEGCEAFHRLITPGYIASLPMRNGFSLVAKEGGTIVGLFAVRDSSVVTLFFVDGERLNKGIGKSLFQAGAALLKQKFPQTTVLTVHSSPYAEKIYERLGFSKTGDETEELGIRYVPMEFCLGANRYIGS